MMSDSELAAAAAELLSQSYPAGEPGAAAVVVREGREVFRGASGAASLELGVPLEPGHVFRIGSITKQFTAAAILALAQEGRLALEDPLARFLPEYPGGDAVTVEHLLNHTSGIRSYTDMPEWPPLWRKDMALDELVGLFKGQPQDFAPGTQHRYNNSGDILLGAIVERLGGASYGDVLRERFFEPLGMRSTCYDVTARIIPGRVPGYSRTPEGYANAEYLSMTQPHGAGGLLSTVGDLAIWDSALAAGRVASPELLARAWRPTRLADGSEVPYGYGWALGQFQGAPTVEHGGGIHGFRTFALRLPEQRTFAAVFSNNEGGLAPEFVALKLAGMAIGRPLPEPQLADLGPARLAEFEGDYAIDGAPDTAWAVRAAEGGLTAQHTHGPPERLAPAGEDAFAVTAMPLVTVAFLREAGAVAALEIRGRSGTMMTARRRGESE